MTVIVFLIDTSASMMQRSYLGTTYLDFARLAVEQFLKIRQRDPASSGDRYMLMTFEEYPYNIKSGWKESQRVFNDQLKGLKAKGLSNFESSLESVMRLLTVNRMRDGQQGTNMIENYGFGRFPCYAQHVVIVPIVDGSALAPFNQESRVPTPKLLIGGDLMLDAFRWDQRLFPIVLRMSGHQQSNGGQFSSQSACPDNSVAENYATQMGGRSFMINSHRSLSICLDEIMKLIQSNGVLIRFVKRGKDPPPVAEAVLSSLSDAEASKSPAIMENNLSKSEDWTNSLVMVKLKPGQATSHWPIPEAFWPETVRNNLPPRRAHPEIAFKCDPAEPMFNQDFPLDKYELDSTSPLARYILGRREPNLCWQLFTENSCKQQGLGFPFGYIKMSSSTTTPAVILYVMPYNYPDLLALLTQAKEGPQMLANVQFQQRFSAYLNTVPAYYYSYLKKALARLKINIPKLDGSNKMYVQINLVQRLGQVKQQGQKEYESACETVRNYLVEQSSAPQISNPAAYMKVTRSRTLLGKNALTDCSLRPAMAAYRAAIPADSFTRNLDIFVLETVPQALLPSQQFKNPFDISRANLCSQLDKMRINFDQQVLTSNLHVFQGGPPGMKIKLQHAEDLANLPISKMGVYEDYMKSLIAIGMGPKRELEPQTARPHAFGNPFKLDKKNQMSIVDEVGEEAASTSTPSTEGQQTQQQQTNGGGSGTKQRKRAASEGPVPVAPLVRVKRRPGPLDANRIALWKRRRRSSSVLGTADELDTLSMAGSSVDFDVVSDPGVLEVDEQGGAMDDEVQIFQETTATESQLRNGGMEGEEEERREDEEQREEEAERQLEVLEILNNAANHQYDPDLQSGHSAAHSFKPSGGSSAPSIPTIVVSAQRTKQHKERKHAHGGAAMPSTSSAKEQDARPTRSTNAESAQKQTLPAATAKQFLEKQKEIRRIVRQTGLNLNTMVDQVLHVADGLSRKRKGDLLEFGANEAERFKRKKLSEMIGEELERARTATTITQQHRKTVTVKQNGYNRS